MIRNLAPRTSGCAIVIASSQSSPYVIAVDSTNVYWVNLGGNVCRAPKNISNSGCTVVANDSNVPVAIAVDP